MTNRGPGYKKFKTPPTKAACISCRTSRVRCSGTSPCARCTKTGRSCAFAISQRGRRLAGSAEQASNQPHPSDGGQRENEPINSSESLLQDDFGGFLPPLFDDNIDAFQFNDIFLGDTDTDLDSFFANIFSLPTFPRPDEIGPVSLFTSPSRSLVRGYRSDVDVKSIQAYYQLLHPVFPILPAPLDNIVDDARIVEGRVYEPASPLILALLAILDQLAPLKDTESYSENAQDARSESSQNLAQCALAAIGNALETRPLKPDTFSASTLHPHVPLELEVPMAYCVMSLYQYLCRGSIDQMAVLAQKALDIFEDLQQATEHALESDSLYTEALRRTWWMSYLCVCNASIVSCQPTVKMIDIDSVRIPYPTLGPDEGGWSRYVHAEETLVAAALLLVALVKGFESETVIPSMHQSLQVLEDLIIHQLAVHSTVAYTELGEAHSPEVKLASCLHIVTRVRLMSARIKIHRYRAFMDSPCMLRRFEEIASIGVSQGATATEAAEPSFDPGKAGRIFPFQEVQARSVCLESATTIASDLEQLATAGTVAVPSVCSAMISAYTLMMTLHFQSSPSSVNPSLPASPDVRLQCETGVRNSIRILGSYASGSNFLMGLKDQLHVAAVACKII